jgi:hypothetical protein
MTEIRRKPIRRKPTICTRFRLASGALTVRSIWWELASGQPPEEYVALEADGKHLAPLPREAFLGAIHRAAHHELEGDE